MKYILLFISAFIFQHSYAQSSSGSLVAENKNQEHIQWIFTVTKNGNECTINATCRIQNGWHIFSAMPFGDGSIAPTQMEVNELKKIKTQGRTTEEGELIDKDMEGLGNVKYYANLATFKYTFTIPQGVKTFTGNIAYQICNDVMCMAPTTKNFSVTIK